MLASVLENVLKPVVVGHSPFEFERLWMEMFVNNSGEKWKISAQGGGQPRWRHDLKEMFYRTVDGKMMAVSIRTAPRFEAGTPRMLFQSPADPLFPNLGIPYAVTADGPRFLINAG